MHDMDVDKRLGKRSAATDQKSQRPAILRFPAPDQSLTEP